MCMVILIIKLRLKDIKNIPGVNKFWVIGPTSKFPNFNSEFCVLYKELSIVADCMTPVMCDYLCRLVAVSLTHIHISFFILIYTELDITC